ncbi:glycoside hydrolase family 32 protein [Dactylonectria estremocensis]|uniref:Glycoside hydrolase family 32 protein n=1 Tax=Dactylonectria estremocensis TaxID=1079267 RepID=A0A9P9IJL0_9HYPO|nr:glycoside hydrolase family 32 protein [Dactylonectria estremocensis]
MQDTTDFNRWRPTYHIIAAHGWMNDPCAPGYNSSTGCYHVNFQWNPKGHTWGNMSWGSAVSSNLVDWTISRTPSMVPTSTQDQCGVFTGALQPHDEGPATSSDQRKLTAFYTSAQKLPINHRLPYTRSSEKLAVATSIDNGKTWQRASDNIIVAEPPVGYDAISWRDPFIGTWKSVDDLRGVASAQSGLYGIISGGLRGQTPTVFLYHISPSTSDWAFLSTLVDLGLNYQPSRWTGGDFGANWEVTNFLTLSGKDGRKRDILITSVEGMKEDRDGGELSKDHRQMWMCGTLERRGDRIQMQHQFGGSLDYGCFYAVNGFWDPLTRQFVAFGWIFEEDLPADLVARQGWSGCLSIPRVANLKTWKGVVGTIHSELVDLTCFASVQETDGTYTMQTVSLTPDPRLQNRRVRHLSASQPFEDNISACASPHKQIEFALSFQVGDSDQNVGFDILHSSDHSQYTRVYLHPPSESLRIDRSRSTSIANINVSPKTAPHTLFSFRDGEKTRREDLDFHVFFDVSVLEVFVNDRVAITTRVYPEEGSVYGIRIYINDEGRSSSKDLNGAKSAVASLRSCDIWELQGGMHYKE